jgi:hypothetical protein
MRNIYLVLISLIFSMSALGGITLGISPEKLEFSGNPNEVICDNFSISGDNSSLFEGSVLWSRSETKNILDYDINSSDLGIDSKFPKLTNAGEYQVCLQGKNSGDYHGALLYKVQDFSYGIGTWIELHVKGNSLFDKVNFISGKSVKDTNPVGMAFISSFALLSLTLIVLIIKLKERKRQRIH